MGCQGKKRREALGGAPESSSFASIDIGSHTIRLLIAQVEGRTRVILVLSARHITRLARNFSEDKTLADDSIQESIAVLQEYATLMHRHRVQSVNCCATGVIRRATNAADFLQRIRKATGISTVILSEEAEAFLSAKGVISGLPRPERFVLSFDLGGSSTELLLVDTSRAESLWSTSIFIGAATITERFLPGDPPAGPSLVRAAGTIRDALSQSISEVRALLENLHIPFDTLQLVGTAGTVTTLAAMLLKMETYDASRVNGFLLTEGCLIQLIDTLSGMPLADRRKLVGLEKGREAIILGGALIVRELMRGLDSKILTVVDSGLLEGLLLALIEKEYGWPAGLSSRLTFGLRDV
jgi:exopolyphosphatase/guanosine-5'-triphosphate,3'-diphosphate pyrophosphatase